MSELAPKETRSPAATPPAPPSSPWPFARSVALAGDPIVQGLVLIVVATAVFLIFPGLDLWFSRLFFEPGIGFPVAGLEAFVALREFAALTLIVPMVAFLAVILIKLALPDRRTLIDPRHMVFAVSALVAAPGLVVNGIFKANWGRPRPVHIEEFGGEHPFIGVWDITDYCASNCSFVSGEASSALWLLTLTMLLPVAWRATGVKAVLALALILSINRIAFGGHFLSDVLLSWGMTLAIIVALHRLIYVRTPAALTYERLEGGLTEAGRGLRRLFARDTDS